MVKRWLVLDLINGSYSKLSNGMTAYFEAYEWSYRAANYCNEFYSTNNRFEIIEVEIEDPCKI